MSELRQSVPRGGRGSFRYPKTRRLRKRRDFLRLQDSNVRVGTKHFVVLLCALAPVAGRAGAPSPHADEPPGRAVVKNRLGVVASKKIGGAVQRNRTKRLLREAFRNRPELFPAGVDLVIIARAGAPELSLADVCREIGDVSGLLARRARSTSDNRARTAIEGAPQTRK